MMLTIATDRYDLFEIFILQQGAAAIVIVLSDKVTFIYLLIFGRIV